MSTAEDIRDIWKEIDLLRDMRGTVAQTKHLLDGNGTPPLSVRLERLEAFRADMVKLKWIVIGSVVATLIGVCASAYTSNRATAAAANSTQGVQQVLSELKTLTADIKASRASTRPE